MENIKKEQDNSENKNKIDYSLFSSEPEKLISLSTEQLRNNNYDQSIDILKNAINLAEKKFGGESNIELVLFYNKYANAFLEKIMLTSHNDINISSIKETSTENSNNPKTNKQKLESQIAFEYLNKANIILKKYLEKYDDKNPSTLDKEIIKYYLYLGYNYNLFAILEKINLDFEKATEYYKLSINYTKKYENKFSRNLASLYFELAQILIYDPFNCLLCLYKSKVIMEYYLQNEINKTNLDIKLIIDEKDLDLDKISYNSDKIFKNKKIIESNVDLIKEMEANLDIKEFVDIIKDINNKIENVISEINEYVFYVKNKEQKEKGENNNGNSQEKLDFDFGVNNDVFNMKMNKIGVINLKRSEPTNNDSDIKKIEEEDYSKEKYI